jgi:hypothetical protein
MEIELVYKGLTADSGRVDFYDAAQALQGFQRSLALTTHLVLNGEVIVQAPSLRGAEIYLETIEEGSWKVKAAIAAAFWAIGTAPKDTPYGHLIWSAYDYVISETLGFNVNYDETLGQSYQKYQAQKNNQIPILKQSRFDSLIEKCEKAVLDMHRPIIASKSAKRAEIYRCVGDEYPKIRGNFTEATFEYLVDSIQTSSPEVIEAKITSYNSNTFKGRCFNKEIGHPVPFDLSPDSRTDEAIDAITESLTLSARRSSHGTEVGTIMLKVLRNESKKGRLKSFYVIEVNPLHGALMLARDLE